MTSERSSVDKSKGRLREEARVWLLTLAFLSTIFGLFYFGSWVIQSGCELHDYTPGDLHGRPWCRR